MQCLVLFSVLDCLQMAPLGTCKTGCSREKTEGQQLDEFTREGGGHGTVESPDFVTGEELVEFAIPGEGNATEKGHSSMGEMVDRPRCFDGNDSIGIDFIVSEQHNPLNIVRNQRATDPSVNCNIAKRFQLTITAFVIL